MRFGGGGGGGGGGGREQQFKTDLCALEAKGVSAGACDIHLHLSRLDSVAAVWDAAQHPQIFSGSKICLTA